jgi:hypothetical protein
VQDVLSIKFRKYEVLILHHTKVLKIVPVLRELSDCGCRSQTTGLDPAEGSVNGIIRSNEKAKACKGRRNP